MGNPAHITAQHLFLEECMKKAITSLAAILCLIVSAQSADYFPLAKGNNWNYAITTYIDTFTFIAKVKLSVVKDTLVGADPFFIMKIGYAFDSTQDSSTGLFQSNGNDIRSYDSLDPYIQFDKIFEHQPVAGHTWKNASGEIRTIVYYGRATVAAGTFDSCYAIVDSIGDTTEVYAPDVGMIKVIDDPTILFELSSYKVIPPNRVLQPQRPNPLPAFSAGIHPGRYSILNAEGRCIETIIINKNGRMDRALSPGTYFLVEKGPLVRGNKRAMKLCVTGR
jgi:hypothetical protein